jgi:hypothetical protein
MMPVTRMTQDDYYDSDHCGIAVSHWPGPGHYSDVQDSGYSPCVRLRLVHRDRDESTRLSPGPSNLMMIRSESGPSTNSE